MTWYIGIPEHFIACDIITKLPILDCHLFRHSGKMTQLDYVYALPSKSSIKSMIISLFLMFTLQWPENKLRHGK